MAIMQELLQITLNIAVECVEKGMEHPAYVEHVGSIDVIEHVQVIVLDLDAYTRVAYIVNHRTYLK